MDSPEGLAETHIHHRPVDALRTQQFTNDTRLGLPRIRISWLVQQLTQHVVVLIVQRSTDKDLGIAANGQGKDSVNREADTGQANDHHGYEEHHSGLGIRFAEKTAVGHQHEEHHPDNDHAGDPAHTPVGVGPLLQLIVGGLHGGPGALQSLQQNINRGGQLLGIGRGPVSNGGQLLQRVCEQ